MRRLTTTVIVRILHILDHSIPLHSGYTFRTLSILREQRKLGWETCHLTTPRQGRSAAQEEEVDGWHFFRTASAPDWTARCVAVAEMWEMAKTARRIGEVVDRVKPDIIHAHSPVLNAFPALWVGRVRGLPVVYELRASWEDAAVDHGVTTENSARYRLSRWLETVALRRADQVTTICEGLRREVESRGIPGERVTIIPNAVDTTAFSTGAIADEALRDQMHLRGFTVLGFVGSFYAYEGLDLLIEALAPLRRGQRDIKLLLVGGGPHEPFLRQRIAALELQDFVIFTGRVPNRNVQRYYDLIDILVYPRRSMRLTELVTPLKPLEAMAQGRMVIASDVGGHRELIRDGETGFLFPAGDATALAGKIAEVLARRAEWERLRRDARHFVETERTWTASVARYQEVYRRASRARLEVAASH